MACVTILSLLTAVRDVGLEAKTPNATPPTLVELNTAIKLSGEYLDGLERSDGNQSVQSETYALPIAVRCGGRLYRPGPEGSVKALPNSAQAIERLEYEFGNGVRLRVTVNWHPIDRGKFTVAFEAKNLKQATEILLGNRILAKFAPRGVSFGQVTLDIKQERGNLKTWKYLIRHSSQIAYLKARLEGDEDKAIRFSGFMLKNDITPGKDLRAVIAGVPAWPSDVVFDASLYPDCKGDLPDFQHGYPYRSKACAALFPYMQVGARDTYAQSVQALTTIQDLGPNGKYPQGWAARKWMQGSTPADTSLHLQRQWSRTGHGIAKCMPWKCEGFSSGIRTFTFGTLETIIGYQYDDEEAREYADAAAAEAVRNQVVGGVIRTKSGDLYRPVHNGAFLSGWDSEGRFATSDSSLVLKVIDSVSMNPEYMGFIPSNAETTFDGWAFLIHYRCAKYQVCTI